MQSVIYVERFGEVFRCWYLVFSVEGVGCRV